MLQGCLQPRPQELQLGESGLGREQGWASQHKTGECLLWRSKAITDHIWQGKRGFPGHEEGRTTGRSITDFVRLAGQSHHLPSSAARHQGPPDLTPTTSPKMCQEGQRK